MTEDEILAEITLVSTAISHILQAGQEYSVGTGQSRRDFTHADLDKLRDYRRELQRELASLDGDDAIMVGF